MIRPSTTDTNRRLKTLIDLISAIQAIGGSRLRRVARQLRPTSGESRTSQGNKPTTVRRGFSISLGDSSPSRTYAIGLNEFGGHGLILGATGAGKTWAAVRLIHQVANQRPVAPAIGVIDVKGDLYDRVRQLLAAQDSKPICLDFSAPHPVPYALLTPQSNESPKQLVDRRMANFGDLLGSDSQLSLRMSRALRNVLLVAVEHRLAFPLVEFLLANPTVCASLGARSQDERVAAYFGTEFQREQNTTVPAVLARLDFVLRNDQLRLSFGSRTGIDLSSAMDVGTPILINIGATLPRPVGRLVQSILLSDLRQAVFARRNRSMSFSWFLDEAQALMVNRADTDNLIDIFTMARSFGAGVILMTQSIAAAAPSNDFLHQLETNVRWMLMFRCGIEDARLIEPGLPIRGGMVKQRHYGGRVRYFTEEQERNERLRAVASLPTHHAYAWLRSGGIAQRVLVPTIDLPDALPERSISEDRDAIERQLRKQEERVSALVGRNHQPDDHRLQRILEQVDGALAAEAID